jgi:hypothetical protein
MVDRLSSMLPISRPYQSSNTLAAGFVYFDGKERRPIPVCEHGLHMSYSWFV